MTTYANPQSLAPSRCHHLAPNLSPLAPVAPVAPAKAPFTTDFPQNLSGLMRHRFPKNSNASFRAKRPEIGINGLMWPKKTHRPRDGRPDPSRHASSVSSQGILPVAMYRPPELGAGSTAPLTTLADAESDRERPMHTAHAPLRRAIHQYGSPSRHPREPLYTTRAGAWASSFAPRHRRKAVHDTVRGVDSLSRDSGPHQEETLATWPGMCPAMSACSFQMESDYQMTMRSSGARYSGSPGSMSKAS